jgi:hypothetical protein
VNTGLQLSSAPIRLSVVIVNAQGSQVDIVWKGVDGSRYEFAEYAYDSDWTDSGGIYIFAARLPNGDWNPLFVGNAHSLEQRLQAHDKWPWAVRLGATGVLACAEPDDGKRRRAVAEMIARLKPPLNEHPEIPTQATQMGRRMGGHSV